jgi:hypothetical protein
VEYRLASSPSERWTQATNSTRPRRYTHTDDLHGQYTSGWMHEVILPDLILSRQTYLYRVKIDGGNDWSKNYWFVTRSGRPDARVRLAVLGDQDLPTTLGAQPTSRLSHTILFNTRLSNQIGQLTLYLVADTGRGEGFRGRQGGSSGDGDADGQVFRFRNDSACRRTHICGW